MGLARRLLEDFRHGENIDAYVTVVAAVVLSALNIADVLPAGSLSGVILAVLALLAIGTLVTRARLEAMADGGGRARLPPFPVRWGPEYLSALDGDGDLYLQGVSLGTTIIETIHALERRLRTGRSVRVLLIKPGSDALRLAEDRLGVPPDQQRREEQTRISLAHLAQLSSSAAGTLEVRLIDQELSFGAAVLGRDTSQAVIYLQYYAYRGTADGIRLVIRPADSQWYDYHLGQIDELWNHADPWTASSPGTIAAD